MNKEMTLISKMALNKQMTLGYLIIHLYILSEFKIL